MAKLAINSRMMSFRAAVVCVLALTFASSSTDDSFFQITEGKIEDLGTMRITNTKTGKINYTVNTVFVTKNFVRTCR